VEKNSIVVLLMTILLFPSAVFATTPAITNVTGTVSQGQTLTITGTTMVDEDKTNWMTMFTSGTTYGFETTGTIDKDSGGDGYDPTSGSIGNSNCTIGTDATVKLMGSRSLKVADHGTCTTTSCGECDLYFTSSNPNNTFLRFYARFNQSTWPTAYQKLAIVIPASASYGDWYFQPYTAGGTPEYMLLRGGDSESGTNQAIPSGAIQNSRWYCFEVQFNHTGNYIHGWVDGVSLGANVTMTNSDTVDYIAFGVPNYQFNSTPSPEWTTEIWFDSLTSSSSRIYPSSIVEIGDSATYATATKVYQVPTTLSDTSVVITADLTGLGAGPYYLFVTNNKQETSSAYNLTGGGTTTMTGITITGGSIR